MVRHSTLGLGVIKEKNKKRGENVITISDRWASFISGRESDKGRFRDIRVYSVVGATGSALEPLAQYCGPHGHHFIADNVKTTEGNAAPERS